MAIVAIAIRDARFMVVVRARRGVAASRGRARVASRAFFSFGFFSGFDGSGLEKDPLVDSDTRSRPRCRRFFETFAI